MSHALSQHLYEASNAEDGFPGTTPCNSRGTWDAAADGISDGLQVIHRRHQQRLTGDWSHALSQHRYDAGNAEDGV